MFVAKDVADILEYRDAPTMTRNLDDDEKLLHTMCVAGQNRKVSIIVIRRRLSITPKRRNYQESQKFLLFQYHPFLDYAPVAFLTS